MTDTTKSRGQVIAADVSALLRARNPLIWITTREESRVESLLVEAAASANYTPVCWDVGAGLTQPGGKVIDNALQDCGDAMRQIREFADGGDARRMWIMRDLPVWISGGIQGAAPLRLLRNLARHLPTVPRDRAQCVVVLSPDSNVPPELSSIATVIDWPLPDRAEIAAILDNLCKTYNIDLNGQREMAINAAVGLSGDEAQACYAKSLVQTKTITPAIVAAEKKRVIAKEKVLTWYDPIPGGLDAVGGLENLKAWLVPRKNAYSKEAREYGLPAPKGVFLVGVSGCGKSLTPKCIATAWDVPLIRLDLNALKDKFVGGSEANIRRVLGVIEAIGFCVVLIDEIEKALQGATSGSADGGTSADALGTLLTWMQERTNQAFIVATANDVSALPPELLRKGRFDEVFFVDLPNEVERVAVLNAALAAHNRKGVANVETVAAKLDGFTGAEIAALVPDALYAAFNDSARDITAADLTLAASAIVPLSKTAAEKITALRTWAKTRARPASKALATVAASNPSRTLDV